MQVLKITDPQAAGSSAKYQVVAVVDGGVCPTINFITKGQKATESSRLGLARMLQHIGECGFENIPQAWSHEANKESGIYELIKGDLRLFYFKGEGNTIAVCTSGAIKKGKKADKNSVQKAIAFKEKYFNSVKAGNLEILEDA